MDKSYFPTTNKSSKYTDTARKLPCFVMVKMEWSRETCWNPYCWIAPANLENQFCEACQRLYDGFQRQRTFPTWEEEKPCGNFNIPLHRGLHDVHLLNFPIFVNRYSQQATNGDKFCHRCKCPVKVNTFNLSIYPFSNKSCPEAVQSSGVSTREGSPDPSPSDPQTATIEEEDTELELRGSTRERWMPSRLPDYVCHRVPAGLL